MEQKAQYSVTDRRVCARRTVAVSHAHKARAMEESLSVAATFHMITSIRHFFMFCKSCFVTIIVKELQKSYLCGRMGKSVKEHWR